MLDHMRGYQWKIDRPLQRHGDRLEHNETYCGSCYGAEAVASYLAPLYKYISYIEFKICPHNLQLVLVDSGSVYQFIYSISVCRVHLDDEEHLLFSLHTRTRCQSVSLSQV
ncbi:hypothetical protein CFOL_v3_23958 [Cephalotus follicularis]|uniref:Uncharacterized protein n=1 Tax=Cephalotus follicularis TaxID=3775 RepID=A0A1Q3CJV1_CEPFO|nr:hypothetical protein CFOL_v3_23958 [Cephalotus follicularis]